jgi:hypothetical protein
MDLYDAIQIAVSMVLDVSVTREESIQIDKIVNEINEDPDSFTIKKGKQIINGAN